jgi:hypothetical protein
MQMTATSVRNGEILLILLGNLLGPVSCNGVNVSSALFAGVVCMTPLTERKY